MYYITTHGQRIAACGASRNAGQENEMKIQMTREVALQIGAIMEEQYEDAMNIEKAFKGAPFWKKRAAVEGFVTKTYEHIADMIDPGFDLGDDRVQVGKMAHDTAEKMLEPEDGDYGRG